MKRNSQTGAAHLALVLLLLIVAVVAFVGYTVAKNHSSTVSDSTQSAAAPNVQTIKSQADLNAAESTLKNTNVDGDLNPDSLNSDVSSLL